MPSSRFEWLDRVKAVEREYGAMRLAADRLLGVVRKDPTAFLGESRIHDLEVASDGLEATYTIRLFAEFETSLRKFWATLKQTTPPAGDLLNGVGTRRRIPYDQISNAHHVREYRNTLVHEREEETELIPIAQARGHLCRFLNFLPLEW